jgi:hypothetical protein
MSTYESRSYAHNSGECRSITEIGLIPSDNVVRVSFDRPPLAFGADVTCCQDQCHGVQTLLIAIPVDIAGHLIAALTVDAEKQGQGVALMHHVEQAVPRIRECWR